GEPACFGTLGEGTSARRHAGWRRLGESGMTGEASSRRTPAGLNTNPFVRVDADDVRYQRAIGRQGKLHAGGRRIRLQIRNQ
ncbi:MAG: hypothetical protein R3282_02070, partial [Rhodothermales bacterium]|nr:hypothetical protein [Rhodothermales bacterium]